MADATTTNQNGGGTQQTGTADPSGSGEQPRTFTQEQVDKIVQERLARAKATPPADYEDLKAKAARLDEIEEAQKSDLDKAKDATAKAQAEAADWKAKFEAAQAQQERAQQVAQMASQYKVDAGLLGRMSGDVEENAKYLAGVEAARPKFGSMSDGGNQRVPEKTLDEALKDAKSTKDRIRIRAEFNAMKRNQNNG
jgi:predicted Abi (CAAX) family protease